MEVSAGFQEGGELVEGDHGGAVGEGCFGVWVGFEEEGVGACGEGGLGDGPG